MCKPTTNSETVWRIIKKEDADVVNSQMADEIRNKQDHILKHWMDYQLSALTLRRDRVKESDLREMSRQFLDLFSEAFSASRTPPPRAGSWSRNISPK